MTQTDLAEVANHQYWEQYYAHGDVPEEPSAFARFVADRFRGTAPIIESTILLHAASVLHPYGGALCAEFRTSPAQL